MSSGTDSHGRVLYGTLTATGATPKTRGTRTQVLDLTNSSGDYTWSMTGQLQKAFTDNFDGSVSYTYQQARDVASVTSSTAGSNYRYQRDVSGRLDDRTVGKSKYDQPHRIIATGSYRFPTFTDVSVIYTGNSGAPYDYVYGSNGGTTGDANGDGQSQNDLIYVPKNALDATEILFTGFNSPVTATRANSVAMATAFENYSATYEGRLPAPATTTKAGKPLLSWRVAILPFIDEDQLFKEFAHDEPWDSVHNKKLLAKMPRIFAPIGVKPRQANSTFYQVFVGPGALYRAYHLPSAQETPASAPGGRGGAGSGVLGGLSAGVGGADSGMQAGGRGGPPSFAQISHPFSTFLIVEAGTPVLWTKPEDIPYDAKKPLPALGGQFSNVFHAAFADGRVRSLPKALAEATIRAGITPAGGRFILWDQINRSVESPLRQKLLNGLQEKNDKLKEEVTILGEVLGEVKSELTKLRWAIEEEKMLTMDPKASALKGENEAMEKALEKGRDEARKLIQEVRKLREAMRKKSEK